MTRADVLLGGWNTNQDGWQSYTQKYFADCLDTNADALTLHALMLYHTRAGPFGNLDASCVSWMKINLAIFYWLVVFILKFQNVLKCFKHVLLSILLYGRVMYGSDVEKRDDLSLFVHLFFRVSWTLCSHWSQRSFRTQRQTGKFDNHIFPLTSYKPPTTWMSVIPCPQMDMSGMSPVYDLMNHGALITATELGHWSCFKKTHLTGSAISTPLRTSTWMSLWYTSMWYSRSL